MLVLGFNGGINRVDEDNFADLGHHSQTLHDGAAVLLRDGEVVCAIEQERLDRIKHSNKAPLHAIRFCVESQGLAIGDIDYFANFTSREAVGMFLRRTLLARGADRPLVDDPRSLLDPERLFAGLFQRELGHPVRPGQLHFVKHHLAHGMSAFALSGFERSLVLTIDGEGEGESGRVLVGDGATLETLKVFPAARSLGHFYVEVIRFLGFKLFDEYKAMGLAPYGDPARFRSQLRALYELLPDGDYALHFPRIPSLFELLVPRAKSEPFTQVHHDLAAALQELLETVAFHVLRHWQQATGERKLCLAGGVAHNCTLNGKILASGLFDEVFVQPAAHDAGCALGAALWVHLEKSGARPKRLRHLYWGTNIPEAHEVAALLDRWAPLLRYERLDDVAQRTARLLADGKVIGWVQGRSEFGPRALGNRSILADPRPAENKEIINAMVKKREGFRPFAPSVLEERAGEFFDIPRGVPLPFMIFVVPVREDKRALLGAITHVDGTARVQTVARETNPRYWQLLREFDALTGVPVLLNTSFNNHAEPIVDSVEDAIVCFLTTHLHHLVVGDWLVSKAAPLESGALGLALAPCAHMKIVRTRRTVGGARVEEHELESTAGPPRVRLSAAAYELLSAADGKRTLGELAAACPAPERERLLTEVLELWSRRLITLRPSPRV